jgi:hypothetical protein
LHHDDETSITEITIAPDGRIYVFGASQGVLEVLDELALGDAAVRERVEHVRSLAAGPTKTGTLPEGPAHRAKSHNRRKDDNARP